MGKLILVAYLISVHILLAIVLIKSDFIVRVSRKFGSRQTVSSHEMTDQFRMMLRLHRRMDENVPDGAVIFIGDSITQGLCVSAIACPSVNYGIEADTTLGVLQRLPYYRSICRASVVVLSIGTNDMVSMSNEEIIENYNSILNKISKRIPIVLNAVLPIDEESRDDWRGRNQKRIKSLNQCIKKISTENNMMFFVDAGPLLVDDFGNLDDRYHVGDGVHLNSKGNAILIDALKAVINRVKPLD